ncbi:PREDICTED: cytokinesis protein sepH-like [Lupinus angustifolius]|uniref:cytokinesis protein sepH-like n=1 Tax=Lupinus angustifolius TaxID=3871 RepID=UPI00092F33F3|nr:PREDICTED: cytokinesis protein sepH-like [Lupinus angustifolius]
MQATREMEERLKKYICEMLESRICELENTLELKFKVLERSLRESVKNLVEESFHKHKEEEISKRRSKHHESHRVQDGVPDFRTNRITGRKKPPLRILIDNKYMLGDEIGKGAYGRVFKGLDLENGDFVAIKQVSLENIAQEDLNVIMVQN